MKRTFKALLIVFAFPFIVVSIVSLCVFGIVASFLDITLGKHYL